MTESTQLIVIQSENSKEFQEEFNKVMVKYRDCDPKYEFVHSLGYCAYVTYLKKDNPKTLQCKDHTCGSCIHAETPPSDRVKWRKCTYFGAVNRNMAACKRYYPEVEYGN